MQYAALTGTDLPVSAVALGLANIGVRYSESDGLELLDAFRAAGGTFLDTAAVYSDWHPGETRRSERILGDWLQSRRCRSEMVIATKGGHPSLQNPGPSRLTRADLTDDLDGSLQALRIDCIDLYYLHRDDPSLDVDDILSTLEILVKEGKIRFYACSNWTASRMAEAEAAAAAHGWTGFRANQMLWSYGSRHMVPPADTTLVRMDGAMHAYHRRTQLAAVPYTSQAQGFFTKRIRQGADPALENSPYATPANEERCQALELLSQKTGVSPTALVLGFLLAQPFPTIPIVGCRTIQQLEASLEALSLGDDSLQALRHLADW